MTDPVLPVGLEALRSRWETREGYYGSYDDTERMKEVALCRKELEAVLSAEPRQQERHLEYIEHYEAQIRRIAKATGAPDNGSEQWASDIASFVEAAAPRPCQHCGLLSHPDITETVCTNRPGNPVSAVCMLVGCQHVAEFIEAVGAIEPRPPAAAVDPATYIRTGAKLSGCAWHCWSDLDTPDITKYCSHCVMIAEAMSEAVRAALAAPSQTKTASPRPCPDGHVWSNDYGDDWTPDVGTPCDCRQKQWGIAAPREDQ